MYRVFQVGDSVGLFRVGFYMMAGDLFSVSFGEEILTFVFVSNALWDMNGRYNQAGVPIKY